MTNILTKTGLYICHGTQPSWIIGEIVDITNWTQDEKDYGKLPLIDGKPVVDEVLKKTHLAEMAELALMENKGE